MSDLESKIRELAARGDITHISLTPLIGGNWSAVYAPASVYSVASVIDADPIKALTRALNEPKLKSRRPKDADPELLAATVAAGDDDDDLGLGEPDDA